ARYCGSTDPRSTPSQGSTPSSFSSAWRSAWRRKGSSRRMAVTEHVLVVPTAVLRQAGLFHGFTSRVEHYLPRLLDPQRLRSLPRDLAEDDPSFKQLIPYVVLRFDGQLFHYRRATGGEKRLWARRSIGIGGHICQNDGGGHEAYRAGMLRE